MPSWTSEWLAPTAPQNANTWSSDQNHAQWLAWEDNHQWPVQPSDDAATQLQGDHQPWQQAPWAGTDRLNAGLTPTASQGGGDDANAWPSQGDEWQSWWDRWLDTKVNEALAPLRDRLRYQDMRIASLRESIDAIGAVRVAPPQGDEPPPPPPPQVQRRGVGPTQGDEPPPPPQVQRRGDGACASHTAIFSCFAPTGYTAKRKTSIDGESETGFIQRLQTMNVPIAERQQGAFLATYLQQQAQRGGMFYLEWHQGGTSNANAYTQMVCCTCGAQLTINHPGLPQKQGVDIAEDLVDEVNKALVQFLFDEEAIRTMKL